MAGLEDCTWWLHRQGKSLAGRHLGEIVAAVSWTDTFLGYRRLARRRGKNRAIVAVGNSVLTIIWHLLADPEARYVVSAPATTNQGSTPGVGNAT